MNTTPKHAATWTDDCQGKKDFDAEFVRVSTRYRPGRATIFDPRHPEKGLHEITTGGPSALSTILLLTDDELNPVVLAECEFEGATEDEVKRLVEAWVDVQFDRVAGALKSAFAGIRESDLE